MDKVYITDLKIEHVRHLRNVSIPIAEKELKHLIITGKNGSGKTSVLEAMARFLSYSITSVRLANQTIDIEPYQFALDIQEYSSPDPNLDAAAIKRVQAYMKGMNGITMNFNHSLDTICSEFRNGHLIIAYYKAERTFYAELPKHVEKVELKKQYAITETPRQNFVKYLLDLKMTEALATAGGKEEKAEKIKMWFEKFQNLLRRLFEEETLNLVFDEETFAFSICVDGREPFDFNTLSSGYAAILDIIVDIIIRMESQTNKTFQFDMPGIVLIDEIETHLHLELQKKILDLLTTVFPNIQFVVSTHSPFILNSLENVVIYDLENHLLVENGLVDIPYDGIVEGYFEADTMSDLLKNKFERYKVLVGKGSLSDSDFDEIAKLELFLDEIPDYLALGITTEYLRLKRKFESREDV